MTSRKAASEAFVWIWLPDAAKPVVAGRLARDGDRLLFNYGRSYLDRKDAISIYEPELPLRAGALPLLPGLWMPSCLRDAAPDAWGRRVIVNQRLGHKGSTIDLDQLDELTYLLESGSDRTGALDFQSSPDVYIPRDPVAATIEELHTAAERVEAGVPLTRGLAQALLHGSAIGGARPKAMIQDGDRKYIAKFSVRTDVMNVVKAEFMAMRLAKKVGLEVAPVKLVKAGAKEVLLVERFDRRRSEDGWSRKAMVSALTLFALDEMMARYASYEDLAEIIRHRFARPEASLREMFGRLVFNILCGNTDDHARNHAAFWDGKSLSLTPAYDICPQSRVGNEASQAMLISEGTNLSRLDGCRRAARQFLLDLVEADRIIVHQVMTIRKEWARVARQASLSEIDRKQMWKRQFLNPFAFEGLPAELAKLAAR